MLTILRFLIASLVFSILGAGVLEQSRFGDPRHPQIKFNKILFLSSPELRSRVRGIMMQGRISWIMDDEGRAIPWQDVQLERLRDGTIQICERQPRVCYLYTPPFEGSEALAYWVGSGKIVAFTLLNPTAQDYDRSLRMSLDDGMTIVADASRGTEVIGVALDEPSLVKLFRYIDYEDHFAGTSEWHDNCQSSDTGNVSSTGLTKDQALAMLNEGSADVADATWVNHDMETDYTLYLSNGQVRIEGRPERMSWFAIVGQPTAFVDWECLAYLPLEADHFTM